MFKKLIFILIVLCTPSCLLKAADAWEIVDPVQAKNAAAHASAQSISKGFMALVAGAQILTKSYLSADTLLGEPEFLDGAPRAWLIARNFDMNWANISPNIPLDLCLAKVKETKKTYVQEVIKRICIGYFIQALVLTAHECSHAFVRYLLTGTSSTILIGSTWKSSLGLLKQGEVEQPLTSLFDGRFVIQGLCLNKAVARPDIDTERLLPYPTWKGAVISVAGGIAGILAAKIIKLTAYLMRHQKEVREKPKETFKAALHHTATLDYSTIFNLYNMLYPAYGLDSYYPLWYLSYKVQSLV